MKSVLFHLYITLTFRDVSLYYYTLAADAGLEIASFNMAWLCEANEVNVHGKIISGSSVNIVYVDRTFTFFSEV